MEQAERGMETFSESEQCGAWAGAMRRQVSPATNDKLFAVNCLRKKWDSAEVGW